MNEVKYYLMNTKVITVNPIDKETLPMTKQKALSILILISMLLGACRNTTDTPPTSTAHTATDGGLLFSEVLTGAKGNNNLEFIEFYNPLDDPVDLDGWELWFQLEDAEDAVLIYAWSDKTLVPPNGHYLLGRADQDIGIVLDAEFDQSLVPSKGGLQLLFPDGARSDSLSWGKGPESFAEESTASVMDKGVSLERLPGGDEGNSTDGGDNAADFILNDSPNPQNTGSPVTPVVDEMLSIELSAPESVEPGSEFEYTITVTNQTGQTVHDVIVELPISAELEIVSMPDGVTLEDGIIYWSIAALDPGQSLTTQFKVATPWTYLNLLVKNYYVQAGDWPTLSFGEPVRSSVEGGLIPISTARTLVGAELTIEGIATMHTGGLFAGSGNVKFYLADETGSIQVWVDDGDGSTNIVIGQRVQVRGVIEAYRGAIQISPRSPDDVVILEPPSEESLWPPLEVSVSEVANDSAPLHGMLLAVEGTVTRVEEFTYSFEIDVMDAEDEVVTLYVDKQTNINVELIEIGQLYRMIGVLEMQDTNLWIYPRVQSDLTKIYPPVLLIEADAPITIVPGDLFTVSLTVYNHTPDTVTNLLISIPLPANGAVLESVLDGGIADDQSITWTVAELAGDGESMSVRYEVMSTGDGDQIAIQGYQVVADQWAEPALGLPFYTFVGDTVPIWAIQGEGFRSPYVLDEVVTSGVVIGVFPDLEGFWIQEIETDDDPRTSAGIFINTGLMALSIEPGDRVEVRGIVRESYQQTQIIVNDLENIVVIDQDNELPAPIELDPPVSEIESARYFEAVEGMLVTVTGPALAVSPINRYGEFVVVLPYHDQDRLWQGEQNGHGIMVDDGTSAVHENNSGLPYAVSTGDTISGLTGPLAYTFGNYKIEPIVLPEVINQPTVLPTLEPTASGEFSMMTWNVENLFDILDPHPSSPPRPRSSEYEISITKVANTILSAGVPTIVSLQEVENIGVLEDIANHELLAVYHYIPILIEGTDGRGIDVGYLVRGDRAEVIDTEQFPAPGGITSRPPLLIKVQITTDHGPATVYVINNHFTSMSGNPLATEPRRISQAAWNVTILESILAEDPDAYVAILGDLNSFYISRPIDTLRDAGLQHVFEVISADTAYTYIYQGQSQVLDHILVTPSLMGLIQRVEVLHADSDYPPPPADDTSPMRKSDHDPVVATFSLQPQSVQSSNGSINLLLLVFLVPIVRKTRRAVSTKNLADERN